MTPMVSAPDQTDWPVTLEATEGRIDVYQPQPESLTGNTLTARAAVSLLLPGAGNAVFGAVWFSAQISTDRDTRIVTFRQIAIKEIRLPGSTPAEQQDFSRAITGRLTAMQVTFPLDELTTSLTTARCEHLEEQRIQTTSPHILFSTTPATLISINGPAKLAADPAHPSVHRVANTPFIILHDDVEQRYFVKAGARWVSAMELTGPWQDAAGVPASITAVGADLSAPATQPAAPNVAELSPAAANSRIMVTTEPTELIVTDGNPQFIAVPGDAGGQLLYANNTASDLFLSQSDQQYYVVLSGRWYAAASLQGPWQYVASDHLPPTFAEIPADSPKASVLSFIAGTNQAREAVLDASIPQTSSISRNAGKDLSVAYDGEPRFADVSQSPGVAYALNTPEQVLRVNNRYYCCHQAVWYDSDAATGPWTVSASVPPAIYTLPPSCPDYNVRYVYTYDYSPDFVTCGYLPGYMGTYVYGPSVVYGTGYDYPGWNGDAYFPAPCTWGFSAYYDPSVGVWGFDVGLYWGGIGWFSHPWQDRWWHDHPGEQWGNHRWWGPGGFAHSRDFRGHVVEARSIHADHAVERGGAIPEARLGGMDHRGAGWNNLYARQGNTARNVPADHLRAFTAAHASSGVHDNVFAGGDGSVFRQNGNGWEARTGGSWSRMDRVPDAQSAYRTPTNGSSYKRSFARPESGLDQHYTGRSMGASRAASFHSSGGGGGGFRGGGGRH